MGREVITDYCCIARKLTAHCDASLRAYTKALASHRPKVYTARVLTPCRPLGNPLGLTAHCSLFIVHCSLHERNSNYF
jgi:hypothetical protein